MRTLVSIIVLISLIYQCTVQLGVFAWFNLNRDYIANELCVNKSKPQSKCNGRCQLSKQLEKTNDSQDQSGTHHLPNKTQKAEITDLLLFEESAIVIHKAFPAKNVHNPRVPHFVGYTPVSAIFHPPAC